MTTYQLTDNELAMAVQSGNITAYNRLYAKYFPIFTNQANIIVRDFKTAEDLAQESLVKIYHALIKKMYQVKHQFITWAQCILKNTVIDYLRTIKTRWVEIARNDFPDQTLNPERGIHYELLRAWIKGQCLRLPSERGKILFLSIVQDFSIEEIMIEMNRSEHATKFQLHKARTFLREQFKNLAY